MAPAPYAPVPPRYAGLVPAEPSPFRNRLIDAMAEEDWFAGECVARGYLTLQNRLPQVVIDADKAAGIRRDFWDVQAVSLMPGPQEPYYFDVKSHPDWRPRLSWNINCSAIENAWAFRGYRGAREVWFGLAHFGHGTPYCVRLEDIVPFGRHYGIHAEGHCEGFWQVDAAEARLPTLDFLLGPRMR
jgi:hypothetical protein